MTLKTNYDKSFYQNQKNKSLQSAEVVLNAVKPLIGSVRSALDIGCGAGGWLRTAQDVFEIDDVLGVDHPDVPSSEMFIKNEQFKGHDLSQELNLERKFDLAISLEVAEHLYAESANRFVSNLSRHADLILFSAALPRQGGTHHVNEQWPDYWQKIWEEQGFEQLDVIRSLIWDEPDVAFWYKQNLFLYARPGRLSLDNGLQSWGGRSIVHPDCWMKKTTPLSTRAKQFLMKTLGSN